MTAEELVTLVKEAKEWDIHKINMVFEGYGVYGFLENFGVDKFIKKMEEAKRLTISDLKIGDIIISEGDGTKYVVLSVERNKHGAFVFSDREDTRYIVDYDIEDFKKTTNNVSKYVNSIINALEYAYTPNPF